MYRIDDIKALMTEIVEDEEKFNKSVSSSSYSNEKSFETSSEPSTSKPIIEVNKKSKEESGGLLIVEKIDTK